MFARSLGHNFAKGARDGAPFRRADATSIKDVVRASVKGVRMRGF